MATMDRQQMSSDTASQRRMRRTAQALALAAALGICWAIVFGGGGTRTALPHVFYIPIVLAALPFGIRGGLAVAVGATVLCGPLMPLDVASGQSQDVMNWLTRGLFFAVTGVAAGMSTFSLRQNLERRLTRHFGTELEPVADDHDDSIDVERVHKLIRSRSFFPVFQPIYCLATWELIGVEALTRFTGEPVHPPDVWFAQATRAGLGVELELAVLDAAIEAAVDLDDVTQLSINLSPTTLCDDRLTARLDRIQPRPLVVEITEHAVVDDYGLLRTALDGLRQRGVLLAVDDAGAGFASLRHIVRLNPDYIKLDISLTQGLRHDPIRRALARALVDFATQTGAELVAEGIEEEDDLAAWEALGAHAAQGYLLGRPAPLPSLAHANP